jgi:hypothetical protein
MMASSIPTIESILGRGCIMFGLFKKQITVAEFGQGIIQLANEPISSDCSRALGMRFEDYGFWTKADFGPRRLVGF